MKKEPVIIKGGDYTGERPLFMTHNAVIEDVLFHDGESPLKESSDLVINNATFQWKYPLWYCKNVKVEDSNWFEMARAGVWYTDNISVKNALFQAPKNFGIA